MSLGVDGDCAVSAEDAGDCTADVELDAAETVVAAAEIAYAEVVDGGVVGGVDGADGSYSLFDHGFPTWGCCEEKVHWSEALDSKNALEIVVVPKMFLRHCYLLLNQKKTVPLNSVPS